MDKESQQFLSRAKSALTVRVSDPRATERHPRPLQHSPPYTGESQGTEGERGVPE